MDYFSFLFINILKRQEFWVTRLSLEG